MCQLAQVSRAGFYRSLQERTPVEEDMELRSAIQQIVLEHRRRYGYRRVSAELRRRGMLGKRPAAEFPLPQSRPVEIHVDQIHKTQKKWNGAGTFGLRATLKKMNDVKNAAEGLRGLSGRTEYD
jgi:hypothetical protein